MSDEPGHPPGDGIWLTKDQLAEIDRCARAYGYEIGKGHPIVQELDELSLDNPFLDPNWRDAVYLPADFIQSSMGKRQTEGAPRLKNIFDYQEE